MTRDRTGARRTPRTQGRWQRWAVGGWFLLALLLTAAWFVGLPFFWREVQTICAPGASCPAPNLPPSDAAILGETGLSVGLYAWLRLFSTTALYLTCLATAVLIIASHPSDGFAIFTAFFLILFGFYFDNLSSVLASKSPAWRAFDTLLSLSQVTVFLFFFLFPDGRFAPRWTKAAAIVAILYSIGIILWPGSGPDDVNLLHAAVFLSLVAACLSAQIVRFRRISTPIQRQQTKLVLFGIVISFGGFLLLVLPLLVQPGASVSATYNLFLNATLALVWLPLVLSIGAAVLRYRLWDAELVVRRTLVYSLLTVLLAIFYFGSVVVLQSLFARFVGVEQSTLAVVISTLAIAALFTPLRRRTQDAIDRRFYRKKYDAQQVLARFAQTVVNETDLDALTAELVRVVQDTLQPERVSIWLKDQGTKRS